jgi:hypothetical protein
MAYSPDKLESLTERPFSDVPTLPGTPLTDRTCGADKAPVKPAGATIPAIPADKPGRGRVKGYLGSLILPPLSAMHLCA